MKSFVSSCLVCGLLVLTSCAPFCPDAQTLSARVRIVHASPDAPAVDVCVNGEPAFEGVEFARVTDYASLPPGTYAVRVTAAGAGCLGAGVIDANLPLSARQDVSVVAVNVLAQIEALPLIDDNSSPLAGRAKVRFVHVSPNAPAVDVTLPDGTTLFDNIAFKQASNYLEVQAGTYTLQVRDETGTVVVLTLNDVQLGAGKVYSVFAVGLLNGTPALNALIAVDN